MSEYMNEHIRREIERAPKDLHYKFSENNQRIQICEGDIQKGEINIGDTGSQFLSMCQVDKPPGLIDFIQNFKVDRIYIVNKRRAYFVLSEPMGNTMVFERVIYPRKSFNCEIKQTPDILVTLKVEYSNVYTLGGFFYTWMEK